MLLKKLEDEILKIQTRLGSATGDKAILLRQDRTAVFKEINTLQQKKLEIITVMETQGRNAQELISVGMTRTDVATILGAPRADVWRRTIHIKNVREFGSKRHLRTSLNYGTQWVHLENDVVFCVSGDSKICYGEKLD